jgi:hypothetical protein
MNDQDRTNEERGLSTRKEEMRQKSVNKKSENILNEDRTNEERGLSTRKEEMRQKNILM